MQLLESNKDILLPKEVDQMRISNVPVTKDTANNGNDISKGEDNYGHSSGSNRTSRTRDIRLRMDPTRSTLHSLEHQTKLRRDMAAGLWSNEDIWKLMHRKLTQKYDENIFNHFQKCCKEMKIDQGLQGILEDLDDFDDIVPNSRIMDYMEQILEWNEPEHREFIRNIHLIIGERTKYNDPFADKKHHALLRTDFASRSDGEIWQFIERRLYVIYPVAGAREIVSECERFAAVVQMDFQGLLDDIEDYFDPDAIVDSMLLQYLQSKFQWSDDRMHEFAVVIQKLLSKKSET